MSITVRNLTKIYGEQRAVNDISFTIEQGEIVGFLELGLECLNRERLLGVSRAPLLVPVEQLGRRNPMTGCNDQLLGNETF